MKSRLILAALGALLATAVHAEPLTGTLKKIAASGVIELGYLPDSVPFSYAANDKQPSGYSVDLCKRVAAGVQQQLALPKLELKWVPVTLANRYEMLNAGKIDVECGTSTNTISRQKIVDFSLMTWIDGGNFVTKGTTPAKGLADLAGKKVGVVKATTTERGLLAAMQRAAVSFEVIPMASHVEGMRALNDGKIDAYAADQTILIGLIVSSGDQIVVRLAEQNFSFEPYGLALRRNDADFKQAVNRVIAQLYRTGEVVVIYDQWFGKLGKPSPLLNAMFMLNSLPE